MLSNLAGLPSLECGYFRNLVDIQTYESRINPSGVRVSHSSIEALNF